MMRRKYIEATKVWMGDLKRRKEALEAFAQILFHCKDNGKAAVHKWIAGVQYGALGIVFETTSDAAGGRLHQVAGGRARERDTRHARNIHRLFVLTMSV